MSDTKLHCGNCHIPVDFHDEVYLDELNTITHKKCGPGLFGVKDTGTFHEIISKYYLFKESLPLS
ncbi:hypothetical protein [Bacillus timonensis]|uniref:hypothetical protein n=1 Tax=Bacillus timonensis TaxID=1033734 RepID=UPI000287B53D|nr:hypothetical protein [Bacillus timonensis]